MSDHYDRYNGMENLLSTNLAEVGTECISIEQEKMIVESLPSLYPLQEFEEKAIDTVLNAIPHWIPVTERLPEVSGEYLVTVKWVTGESDVDVYEYDARHKTWNDGESAGGERAVAWAKLPEPYKGVTT